MVLMLVVVEVAAVVIATVIVTVARVISHYCFLQNSINNEILAIKSKFSTFSNTHVICSESRKVLL